MGQLEDARFAGNEGRLVNRQIPEPLIEAALSDVSAHEAEARLAAADLPYGRLNEVDDLAAHPQLAARERWRQVQSPVGLLRARFTNSSPSAAESLRIGTVMGRLATPGPNVRVCVVAV